MRVFIILLLLLLAPSSFAANTVTFDEALNTILYKNADLETQRWRLEAADSQLLGAKFLFLPHFSLSASHKKEGRPEFDTRLYAANLDWNVFRGGADWAALQASRYEQTQQTENLRNVELSAESKAIEALLQNLASQQQLSVLQEGVKNSQAYLNMAQNRYNRGVLAQEQVDKAQLDFSNREAQLKDAQTRFEKAQAQLRGLWPEGKQYELKNEWPWREALQNPSVRQKQGAFLKADLNVRPDYRAQKAKTQALDQRMRQAHRKMWPSLDFRYSLLQQEIEGKRSNGWAGLLTLSIPLFDGLQDYTQYRVQVAESQITQTALWQLERDIQAEQTQVQNVFRLSLETAEAREKNLQIARRLLQSGQRRFQVGRSDADEFSLDQERVNQAELLAIEGWYQLHLSWMRLLHAHGRSVRGI